jgi:hypothetical protein
MIYEVLAASSDGASVDNSNGPSLAVARRFIPPPTDDYGIRRIQGLRFCLPAAPALLSSKNEKFGTFSFQQQLQDKLQLTTFETFTPAPNERKRIRCLMARFDCW